MACVTDMKMLAAEQLSMHSIHPAHAISENCILRAMYPSFSTADQQPGPRDSDRQGVTDSLHVLKRQCCLITCWIWGASLERACV